MTRAGLLHPAGMRAHARVVAERGAGGRTRLPVLRGASPLLLRRTGTGGAQAHVHLVGGAAGPLAGDDLRLEIEVGPGARLWLGTVAASVALPGGHSGRHAAGGANEAGSWSRLHLEVTVAPGGTLVWQPEPLVAAAGCRHRATARVTLADGARLGWREELVCGRHDEPPGDLVTALTVRYDGRPLHQQTLTVGPAAAPGGTGAAVLGGHRVSGSTLWVEPAWSGTGPPATKVRSPTAARMPLAGPAALATALGPDAPTVRRHLDALAPPGVG